MNGPVISVIVPVYKVEAELQRCIDSILAQTFRDLELILVEDGSPDNCPALCDAAARKDERVVVIHRENGGLSAARNTGLEAARGAYIGFVDGDDFIAPEMYGTLLERMQADGAQAAVCDYRNVTEDGRPLDGQDAPAFARDEVLSGAQAIDRIRKGHFTVAWNRLCRRELFRTVRFPVGRLHEDEYTAHQIYWQCTRVSVVAQQLYFYVQRENSIAHRASVQRQLDQAQGILLRAGFAGEHGLYAAACDACMCGMNLLACITPETPPQAQEYAQLRRRADTLAWQLRKAPGFGREKLRSVLFRLSPRLYRWLLLDRYSAVPAGQRSARSAKKD